MRKLKLFFACLLMAVLSIGQMWATDFTLSSAAEVSQDGITVSFAKGSGSNAPAWYSAGLRLYGSNTITIACDKDITEVTFNWEKQGSKAFASVTASVGDYTHPTNTGEGTWSGTSKSITFTLGSSGQLQLNTFSVTTASGGTPTCATPTFDPEDGEKFDESIDVEINAEDGATIYYTTDGNAPTTSSSVYSTALHFTETTTLKAMAVKAGSNNSAVATTTYTKIVTVPGYAIDFESELDAYVDWEFSNIGIRTSTITAHGGTYYGSNVNGNGNATSTAAIKTKAKVATPGVLTFYISKESNNTTASSWKAQVSADGSEWTDVETFDAKSMSKGAWNECTADLSEYSNVYVRIYYEGSNAIRAIDDIELAEAAAVAKPAISGETPFLTSTTVTLAQAGADHIYYTTNGNEPTTSSTEYTVPFELNATATVKAIAVKGSSESAVAEKTFTKATVLTVAEAIAAIPNKDDVVNNQYVAGIVCTAAPSLLSGGKLTYYISADGSETNRLQIYKGKNLNNTEFTAVSDLAIGDRVTVFGQLKNFNNTPEMNDGNYLVSKETPAVAAPTFSPDGGGFMGETDVTISCATASSAIYYTLDGSAPSKLSTLYESAIHLTATTTINAIAYVGDDASLVIAKTFTLTAPMTVADALTALDTEDPINNVAVAGIISTAPTSNPSSGKLTYYISDDGTDTDELEVFLGFGLNGASFSAKTDLQVGDEVTVFGNLTIFNSTTKEFASGSRLLAFNRPEVAVTGINLTESTAEVEEGKTVTLHASVVPANATNKTIVWSVQSGNDKASVNEEGVVTGIAAGTAVIRAASDADASIYAECTVTVTAPTPLSPWATVYTSNVTMVHTGSGVDNGTITIGTDDPYLLVKAGASSSTGTIVVTVPKGTTDLHFHAFAWGGKTAKIELAGVENASVSEFDLAGEAGASGSGNDFTLQSDPVDQYFHVSFDAVAAETEITFSKATGSADNRFFFYGVNQEGGLILESISVSGTAAELEYNDGDHFSPAGLVVTGHYSNASTAPITEGIVWAFDPDPLTQGTTSVSVTATASGKTSAAFVVDGLTVAGAAPLSPWASVYTSNVTLSTEGGTSASAAKVKFYGEEGDGYDAIKAGTGSAQGAVVVNVPAGATALHFHAYGWNSESVGLTVTAPTGVTVSPATEISINSNSGIASNSPFTLAEGSDPKTDAYYAVSLSGNTEATNITISATSDKRFVLFGVNQEGGSIPVLKSIEISGDLTNKSGYKVGDDLDLDGLTVSAIYTLNEVDQAPVDVTSLVNWSYDPLVEGQTSVTITATLEDKSDDITISDLEAVASADPKIYVSTLSVNFGSVVKDAAAPADQTITVTLTNVASATATLGGTNPEAFSIDPATLTASGDITISVVASTASAANYSATLTISDDATENPAQSKTINLSFAVIEPVVNDEYELVSDVASLAAGDQIIIVAENEGDYYTLDGSISSQYFPSTAVSISAGIITAPSTSAIILGKDEDNWTMSMGGQLIGATAAKKASLGNTTTATNTWTIAIAENVATITNTAEGYGSLQFNYNNGTNPRFLNYASTQTAVAIYKKVTPEPPTPVDYGSYNRNGLTPGNYATICLPNGGTISGATLFDLDYYDGVNTLYLLEVNGNAMVAGRPYIFLPDANEITVTYTDNAGADAGSFRGLVGSYSQQNINEIEGENYILYNNAYYLVNSTAYVGANRAYIHMAGVLTVPSTPQAGQAPRRRVGMTVHGEQTTTDIDALNAAEAPVKVLINGQMYILRGEKMYNVNGQVVK